MVSFEHLINEGKQFLALNRDRGTLDVGENKLTLLKQNLIKEISYSEIESLKRRARGGVIILILKTGEKYEFRDVVLALYNKSNQDTRNGLRKTEMIYNLLMEKLRKLATS